MHERNLCLRILLFSTLLTILGVQAHAKDSAADEARIQRVEQGLLPLVAMQDQLGVTQTIEQRMAAYGTPGLSVAVVEDGEVVWARGYGIVETGATKRVSTDTLFLAGSISKPVAALGALSLVKQGKLTLDGDVNASLESWKVPENNFTVEDKVTLRRLLSHTAGLTVHGFPGYSAGVPLPSLVQILNGEAPANTPAIRVNVQPGSLYRYSGGGYTVMQQMLIDVTGQPFDAFMKANVLGPLSMRSSTYSQSLPADLGARIATGHRPGGKVVPGKVHAYPEMAAAGLWTTAAELAQYIIHVQKAARGTTDKLLNAVLIKEMLTRQSGRHGLGPVIEGEGEAARFQHGGADEGFEATLIGYVHRGHGVVVMANSNLSQPVQNELVASIAREYGWLDFPQPGQTPAVPISKTLLERAPGKYQVGTGNAGALVARDERLLWQMAHGGEIEVFAKDAETLFSPFIGLKDARLVVGESGRVTKIVAEGAEMKRLD